MPEEKVFCEKCRRMLAIRNFYKDRRGERMNICKKCLTMHVDAFEPETYKWILEKMDFPYSPTAWEGIRNKCYKADPAKFNGTVVLGKYLAKMRINQYHDKGWADSATIEDEFCEVSKTKEEELKAFDEDLKKRYEDGQISELEYQTMKVDFVEEERQKEIANAIVQLKSKNANLMSAATTAPPELFKDSSEIVFYDESKYINSDDIPDPSAELTNDDKIYLAMKWGRLYKPNEWIELEKKYDEMMESFEIEDSDSISSLILICKTYLKMNNSVDQGDMQTFQQLSRVYDSLRKSCKFTAAQNKEKKNEEFSSIGELVALCEKEKGFIPKFNTDIPQDKIDVTMKDMTNYLRNLVTKDLGFGQQIEDAIKKLEIQKEMNEKEDEYGFENDIEIDEKDYAKYFAQMERQMDITIEQEEGND